MFDVQNVSLQEHDSLDYLQNKNINSLIKSYNKLNSKLEYARGNKRRSIKGQYNNIKNDLFNYAYYIDQEFAIQ